MANKSKLNSLIKKLKNLVQKTEVNAFMWKSDVNLMDYFKDGADLDRFVIWLNDKSSPDKKQSGTLYVFLDKEIIEQNIENFRKESVS